MFKIGDEVRITNKEWKNFGKTAVILSMHRLYDRILIKTCETNWVKWCHPSDVEPVKKSSVVENSAVDNKPEKSVPFIVFPSNNKNMPVCLIQDKIENEHGDTTVIFGDTFENMKDKIVDTINHVWGENYWDNIYVVCGKDYYHICREVVSKKL